MCCVRYIFLFVFSGNLRDRVKLYECGCIAMLTPCAFILQELQKNNDSLPADGYGYILLSVSQKTLSGYLYRDA
jgi:hypothetical protein